MTASSQWTLQSTLAGAVIGVAASLAFATAAPAQDVKASTPGCSSAVPYGGPGAHPPFTAFPNDQLARDKAMPANVAERLAGRFAELLIEQKASAGSVAIWRPGLGYWQTSIRPAGVTANRFPIVSVTKITAASVILQLADENKLSLSQSVDKWFPGFPNGSVITVDHLLMHTSGLPEFYTAKGGFRDSQRYWAPQEVIDALSKASPSPFCPGARYFYSNINYVMLGMIAEKVEGKSLAAILEARVIDQAERPTPN